VFPHQRARAGIDPLNLLIARETGGNIKTVKVNS
jgi:hypothetical protein